MLGKNSNRKRKRQLLNSCKRLMKYLLPKDMGVEYKNYAYI